MSLRGALTLAIALAALLATGTVASAGTGSAAGLLPPRATLHLTIAAGIGITADTVLTCAPAGGNHPHAAVACVELAAVAADLDRLPVKQLVCPMVYRPVTASAEGRWHGRGVIWSRTFSNPCIMQAATGAVFQF